MWVTENSLADPMRLIVLRKDYRFWRNDLQWRWTRFSSVFLHDPSMRWFCPRTHFKVLTTVTLRDRNHPKDWHSTNRPHITGPTVNGADTNYIKSFKKETETKSGRCQDTTHWSQASGKCGSMFSGNKASVHGGWRPGGRWPSWKTMMAWWCVEVDREITLATSNAARIFT